METSQSSELIRIHRAVLSNIEPVDWRLREESFPVSNPAAAELVKTSPSSLPGIDPKAIRMYEMYAAQTFIYAMTIRRTRMRLLVWVVRNKIKNNLKRTLDLVVCIAGLPFAAAVMLLTAIAIKWDSPGPILFRQPRVGKWGQPFTCYKFRSMAIDAEQRKAELMGQNEADEIVFKMRNDPRVTRVGRVIRKMSIDELPQIFNVLKGEMSLVGPRPPVPYEVEQYELETMRRLEAVPGLTGLQQISGRSELPFKKWVELDLEYIQGQSLLKDIEILVKTIPAVLSGRGAF